MNITKKTSVEPKRATRRTRAQAAHDRKSPRTAGVWLVQHSHAPRHQARGLRAIGRSALTLRQRTAAVGRLLGCDAVTARMIAQDTPRMAKPRGPRSDCVAEATRTEKQRANEVLRYSGKGMVPSRRDRRITHAKAAKARTAELHS